MAVNLSPIWGAGAQLLDNSGNVLSGGKIYTYTAGTTTPATTYTSSNGLTANSNPIILNSAGRVPYEIWLTDGISYKFVLKDSNDTLIATYDNLTGINSNFIAYTAQQEIQTATAGQTVFNLTTMQYQPGTNNLSVFVDGVNQYGPGAQYAYVETDTDTVTFVSGLHVGASVKFTTASPVSSSSTDAQNVSFTGVKGQSGSVADLGTMDGSDWVGFQPAGTGAVSANYSIQDKLRQTVSVKDFGAVGDGVTDDTAAVQAAIDYAANVNGDNPVTKGAVTTVLVPAGKYLISSTLYIGWATYSSTSAFRYCNLIGDGNAQFVYTGNNDCLIIGNNTSYGVLPITVANLKFSSTSVAATATAIQALNAGYCNIENIGIDGFATGLWIRGCIGAKIDGKMSFINSDTCIKIESYQPAAAVLRMAANNISISNYHLGDGAAFGVVIQNGTGVSPSGSGGLIELKYITFESFTNSGIAVKIYSNGEVSNTVNQLDCVLLDHCWFENAGALLVDIANGVAKMQHCWFGPQSAGTPAGVARLNDNYSSIWIDQCYGYNYSTPVVVFGGTATASIAKERVYIGQYRKYGTGTNILHTDWPVNSLGVRPVAYKKFAIQYNSTYPAGNVNSNDGLALDLAAEAIKMFGTGWTYVDVTFVGQVNVSAANLGYVSVRIFNNNVNSLYAAQVVTGVGSGYVLSGTTMTFSNFNASAGWTNMIGVWECSTANGQY